MVRSVSVISLAGATQPLGRRFISPGATDEVVALLLIDELRIQSDRNLTFLRHDIDLHIPVFERIVSR